MRRLGFLVLLGTMTLACSDPDPAPSGAGGHGGGSGTGGSGGSGGTAGASAAGGAGGSTSGAGGTAGTTSEPVQCNELELEREAPVTQWTSDAGKPPEPLGGTVRDGTYFLTRVTMYELGLPDFAGGRTQMVVNGASWESVDDLDDLETDATNPARSFSYVWTPSGTSATFSSTCPTTESIDVQYTADADTLTLYVLDNGVTFGERFERQ